MKKALTWRYAEFINANMKRGAIKKSDCKAVLIYFPHPVVESMDVAVRIQDSDRSKFIRNAVREKLARHGIAPLLQDA